MKLSPRRIALLGIFTALAIVLGILESYIPSFWIPGVKLGLTNLVILLILLHFSPWEALAVNLVRVFLVSLLRGTFLQVGFFMSLFGALFSLLAMALAIRYLRKLTAVGVSILGASFHAVGQIMVAVLYFENAASLYYLPFMMALSVFTGALLGFAALAIEDTKALKRVMKREQTQ